MIHTEQEHCWHLEGPKHSSKWIGWPEIKEMGGASKRKWVWSGGGVGIVDGNHLPSYQVYTLLNREMCT